MIPKVVEASCVEEIYPKVPRPRVVDVRLVEVTSPDPPPPDVIGKPLIKSVWFDKVIFP